MAEMTRRDQELQGLYALRNDLLALQKLNDEHKAICNEQESMKLSLDSAAQSYFKWLPDDAASQYSAELKNQWERKSERRIRNIRLVAVGGAILFAVIIYFLMSITLETFHQEWVTVLCCDAVFTIAIMLYSCLGFFNPFCMDDFWAGYILVSICYLAPLGAGFVILISVDMNTFVLLVLVAMVMLMIVSRILIVASENQKQKLTKEEERLLSEKRAQDARNEKVNKDNYESSYRKVCTNSEDMRNLERKLKRCESEIRTQEEKIKKNTFLSGDDIQWMDKVIYYIQSRRADSIKEALRLVDMEQERERQRKVAEDRHREIMEELEYQSWEAANARAEQREAAERAEKALRDSEAAAERARYEDEMRRYEEAQKAEQHRQNVEWELRKMRDDG